MEYLASVMNMLLGWETVALMSVKYMTFLEFQPMLRRKMFQCIDDVSALSLNELCTDNKSVFIFLRFRHDASSFL